ncbi:MAG: polyprenyl synthetase family protein [Candidatus Pacebacteria bacterium]|nr:polyprenyl synthetase family protein [Candidatus Paceibacterota bacterium]MDD4201656.1 polyprenyl synthetase family protein [Candidatus Paceibacterota bacterium]MDD4467062.1 polyprenyl synthetase family protein [Candidatus Paceibacterota bacterium]MDD4897328.1 polyprenyl synthetase family protein [Candidatus Paceibacterota bacterium]
MNTKTLKEIRKANIAIKKTIRKVEEKMEKTLISNVNGAFHKILKYQIKTEGKRLRPKLAIVSLKMLKGKEKDIIYPAAGLEILHNCSLIIDDIIDDSRLRRGEPSAWVRFGKSIAQCVAMDYSAAIFETALKSKNPERISNIFAKTLKIVMNGEIMDILFEQTGREDEPYIKENRYSTIKEEDYLRMTEQKTAIFIGASCQVGGICANGNKKQIEKLRKYGLNLGMAFQISDDLLDIFGKEERFGKKIGKDIQEGKGGNCVIYFALQEFTMEEKKKFWNILRKDKIGGEDVKKAIRMIKKTKARERAIEYGESFVIKAKKNLSFLPQNKWNDFLSDLADDIIGRNK